MNDLPQRAKSCDIGQNGYVARACSRHDRLVFRRYILATYSQLKSWQTRCDACSATTCPLVPKPYAEFKTLLALNMAERNKKVNLESSKLSMVQIMIQSQDFVVKQFAMSPIELLRACLEDRPGLDAG